MAIAAYCRDRLNPQVFVYSLSTALLHRQDTKDLRIPTFMEVFPSEFLDMQGVQRAAVRANILSNPSARVISHLKKKFFITYWFLKCQFFLKRTHKFGRNEVMNLMHTWNSIDKNNSIIQSLGKMLLIELLTNSNSIILVKRLKIWKSLNLGWIRSKLDKNVLYSYSYLVKSNEHNPVGKFRSNRFEFNWIWHHPLKF